MSGRRTEMTDGGGTTYYGYDLGDRLTSITRSGLTTNSFGYNGLDTRVSKTDSTGTTSYKRAGAGVTSSLLKSTISGTTTDYTPGISSTVSSTSTFMHSGLKNSDEQSGSGGTIAASLQYDAFGKQVSSSGTWVGAFKYGGPYGYQTDPDHGLKLLGHRYYEADTGRFLTRDPIKDGRNWFGYCGNRPVGAADPSGLRLSIINADATQSWLIIGAIIAIGMTEPGKDLVDELLLGETLYTIAVRPAESQIGSHADDESHTIQLNWDDLNHSYTGWGVEEHNFTITRILAHELGHLVGIPGDADNEDQTVREYEDPIMQALGDHNDRSVHSLPTYLRRPPKGSPIGPIYVPGLGGLVRIR